jgi:tetratricopeptide (TPR) repeat protein
VSLTGLFKLRAVRREIERTLELAPDFPDALLGKGALLLALPRLLGGDDEEGERLLRRALEIDPAYVGARLELASALAGDGRRDEAHAEALRALAEAEAKGDAEAAWDARRIVAETSPAAGR